MARTVTLTSDTGEPVECGDITASLAVWRAAGVHLDGMHDRMAGDCLDDIAAARRLLRLVPLTFTDLAPPGFTVEFATRRLAALEERFLAHPKATVVVGS